MADYKLQAQPRELKKRNAKRLREQGLVPGIIYGRDLEPQAIAIDAQQLEEVYMQAGGSQLVEVEVDDVGDQSTIFQEVQFDPVSRMPIHFDLYAVSMDETITTELPIHFEGEAPAENTDDAVIFKNRDHLEIEALPSDLPESVTVDLSVLVEIGDAITVEDVLDQFSDRVEVLTEAGTMLVKADPPRSEEELEELEEAVPVKGAEADMVAAEHGEGALEEEEEGEAEEGVEPGEEPEAAEETEIEETSQTSETPEES